METIKPEDFEKIITKIETGKKLKKREKEFVIGILKSSMNFIMKRR